VASKCVTQCPDISSIIQPFYITTDTTPEYVCVNNCSTSFTNARQGAGTIYNRPFRTLMSVSGTNYHLCVDACSGSRPNFYVDSNNHNICSVCPPVDFSNNAVTAGDRDIALYNTAANGVCQTSIEYASANSLLGLNSSYLFTIGSQEWRSRTCYPENIDNSTKKDLTAQQTKFLINKASTHCVTDCTGTEVYIKDGSDATSKLFSSDYDVDKCIDYCPVLSGTQISTNKPAIPQYSSIVNGKTLCHDSCSLHDSTLPLWRLDSSANKLRCTANTVSDCPIRLNHDTQPLSRE
jgi:hypothetical protein